MVQLGHKEDKVVKVFNLDEAIKKQEKQQVSTIFAGLSGEDDTAKTGIAFCIRNQEDFDKERRIFVIDLDQSAAPIKRFWGNDPRIICLNPTAFYEDGERIGEKDATKTLENIRSAISQIKNLNPDTIAAIVFDGCDILLRNAEDSMKEEDLGIDIYASGKAMGEAAKRGEIRRTDWRIRDRKYDTIIDLMKNLSFPVILITHMKEKKKMIYSAETGQTELQVTDIIADWGKYTRAQCFQRIKCEKRDLKDKIEWVAIIEKSKGDPTMTGNEIIVMEKDKKTNKVIWKGFDWELFR